MPNVLEYAKLFETNLDLLAIQTLKTGFMDGNSGKVKYSGGNEVKVPKMSVQGLGDYSRENGYTSGSVSLVYQTLTMTQDRGRKFLLDAMDVDETNFIANASDVMGEFQRTRLVPEIDAYRISKLATTAMGVAGDTQVEYGYTVGNDIINKIKKGIKAIRSAGYDGELDILATYDVIGAVEEVVLGKLTAMTFAQGGINTQVPQIDGCPLIAVPSNRMYTSITLYDGKTAGQEAGGYIKGTSAKDINFIIVARTSPIAVTKQDKMRIFTPETYQNANSWSMDYRRYHDIWVLDNKKNSLFVNIKDTKV
ncbi:hypothetical protein [Anaerotignum sp.]|uniref:hypothetical protein n=1 Tax=Anaerotignum sp. TaxID=2039241 RepID=UPI0028A0AAE2|nr:hypothetical protein [Anaerotignum sp.]